MTQILVAWGPVGILLLSILDSCGIPVGPLLDVALVADAIASPRVGWWCAGAAVAGSTVGNVILFQIARKGGQRFLAKSTSKERASRFRAWFLRYGLLTVFVPALLPIPLPMKLFVITAGVLGTPLSRFLSVVISARFIRYFGEAWFSATLGNDPAGYLRTHVWQFTIYAVALFAVLYAIVAWRFRNAAARSEQ